MIKKENYSAVAKVLSVGGVSGVIICVFYLVITVIYVVTGMLEGSIEEKLGHIGYHTEAWWWILILSVITDLLLFVFVYALYRLLSANSKSLSTLGCFFIALFAILDLAITWPSFELLIRISSEYVNGTMDSNAKELVEMAKLLDMLHSSRLFAVYVILLMSLGIVILSNQFKKQLGYHFIYILGISISVVGSIAVIGAVVANVTGIAAIIVSVLSTIWIGLAGIKLFQLSGAARNIGKKE